MRKLKKNIINFNFITILFLLFLSSCQPNTDIKKSDRAIRTVLAKQEKAWSDGNLDEYMNGYWKNDSLKFIGKSGIQYGWQKTTDNYKKSYPDKASMGTLKFNILTIDFLSSTSAYVIGKWDLTREKGDIGGYFSLLFKEIDKKWVIVCDHSS